MSTTAQDQPVSNAVTGSEAPGLADAWRRFWARSADMWLGVFMVSSVLQALAPSDYVNWHAQLDSPLLERMLFLPLALALDAVFTAAFGTTVAKAVAGIKVRGLRGERLSLAAALKRNFSVWLWGLGLGVPYMLLVTMWSSKQRLENGELTIWDESLKTRCFVDPGTHRHVLRAFACFVVIAAGVSTYNEYRSKPSVILAASVRAIRATSPYMVDRMTRVDGAEAGPRGELIYRYTVLSAPPKEEYQKIRKTIVQDITDGLVERTCSNPNHMATLRSGVPIVHRYDDATGRRLASIRVDYEMCQKRSVR